ncbi:hypothetical protein [Clostridium magnum]|uniref:Uncharacterized protein n=1 Tax=Clostridium magnum DSM 2767 TaxID=1121326 RepID=A0A162RUU6_9CLOT|nr:hypothetical protein [Clostridium magnum]KZL90407.1 hypothetical protein CLMAG_41780 [Clostridium magnum DSM 2767]SHH84369.1 hypothetical protein SAMN02745944_01555 [Clostridium magnum DSM 2767]
MGRKMDNTTIVKCITLFFIGLTTITAVIFYNKFENAKYAFNRNCYYRLENLQSQTNEAVKKLDSAKTYKKVSESDVAEFVYLNSIIRSEQWYIGLAAHDYQWKIGKLEKTYQGQGSFGIILDSYFEYLKQTYKDKNYINYDKENEKIDLVFKYYQGIQKILNGNLENVGNTGSLDKHELINKEKWVLVSSEINKFDEDFKAQYSVELVSEKSK